MTEVLDAARLQELAGDVGGELAAELIDEFLGELEERLATLEEAVDRGDAAAAQMAAHTLKSTSLVVGAAPLAGRFRDLEALARDGDLASARLADLRGEAARARTALEEAKARF